MSKEKWDCLNIVIAGLITMLVMAAIELAVYIVFS